MNRVPLLVWSDAPSGPSGLARISRELCTRIATEMSDVFRVASIGHGSAGSHSLPFQQYSWKFSDDFVVRELPEIWKDWHGDEGGVLLAINDLARCWWLGQPENPQFRNEPMCQWVQQSGMKKWIYAPIDAEGPNGKLSFPLRQTMLGFDRVLLYSKWSQEIVERSGVANTQAIPHGIDTEVFYPYSYQIARHKFGEHIIGKPWHIKPDEYLIGIVATNQPRKDWHLAIQTAAILRDEYKKNVWLWLHTDALERYWSLPTLLYDYGFIGASRDSVFVTTGDLSDDQMARGYSACDVTFGIGRGEGFGLPVAESLACGTPVIHGAYGGALDWMPKDFLVQPVAYNHEGLYADKRPVFDADDWALAALNADRSDAKLPPCLEWKTLWGQFESWFRSGVNR
jgi:glycosyltransferase involved in cell wall biosynthesis